MAHPPRVTGGVTGDAETVRALASLAAAAGGSGGGSGGGEVLSHPRRHPGTLVVREGGTVVKAHAPGTDAAALARRLAAAAHPALGGVLLSPLRREPAALPDGRAVTLWPCGSPVEPDEEDAVPWQTAGRLLAALHAVDPAPFALPRMGGPARAARTVALLWGRDAGSAARAAVARVWAGLPAWCRDEAAPPRRALCHGDFHLGQLVRCPASSGAPGERWRLIDVDELGTGEPAWDLARPAAWYAAGLLPPAAWDRFLGGYGPGLGDRGDPWPYLDAPARAVTAQLAAAALLGRERGEGGAEECEALVDACTRIARHSLY